MTRYLDPTTFAEVLVSLLVISLFAVLGQQILHFLGIGIPALQGGRCSAADDRRARAAHRPAGRALGGARRQRRAGSARDAGARRPWGDRRFSVGITRVIREAGIVLLTRIAGLLLSAIAVQLIADSGKGFLAESG